MQRYFLERDGEAAEVTLEGEGAELLATVDGRRYQLECLPVHRDAVSLRRLDGEGAGHSYWAHVGVDGPRLSVKLRNLRMDVEAYSEREWHFRELGGGAGASGAAGPLVAPMPGKVLKVLVAPGDPVEEGTPLAILEAMKMENELKAKGPARVATVEVADGEAVEKDAVLVTFEEAGDE